MSFEHPAERPVSSLEIIKPFIDLTSDAGDVQIMGGVGTAALFDSNVEIDVERREVIAPPDFYQSSKRPNGSRRDVDVFVSTSDPERVAEVCRQLKGTVGEQLERSVFGIHPHQDLADQLAKPFGRRVLQMAVSDRYEASPDETGTYIKSLFPFAAPIDPETLEPWTLVTERGTVAIPHPGVTITNYTNRSLSGLRHKDADKIAMVTENVLEKAPEIREWLYDGPGASQLELSKIVASVRRPGQKDISLADGITADLYTRRELLNHEYLMIHDMPTPKKLAVFGLLTAKAHTLHRIESMDLLIDLWQKYNMERHTGNIVTNS